MPEAVVPGVQSKEIWVDASTVAESTAVAVEVSIPVGARSIYGMLGMQHTSGSSPGLLVRAHFNEAGTANTQSLALPPETTHIGLLPEYASSCLCGVERFTGQLPQGRIDFRWGAYGDVGSSESVFEALGTVLVMCLVDRVDLRRDPALESAIRACIKRFQPGQPY